MLSLHSPTSARRIKVMDLDSKIAAMERTLEELRQKTETKFDGRVLSTAFELIFLTGLRKMEIPEIKIK